MVRRLLSAETERYLAEQHRRERVHGEGSPSPRPIAKDDIIENQPAHSPIRHKRPLIRVISLCLAGALLCAAMIWFETRPHQP